ncbi:hemocyte protein-glutamine gamma-glutamyltransferase-like [Elysia marginata]|uniref:Hemocyte protein-glutamine gamma-glutamyltransferase-like n=1 Tax=Elysia marginata TaxID=1093978 RepID=A0AAV4F8X0_9GAST|nr:hemocyte protein-glutamine gamma-glutamyltransferase-like [Elysia marginata]
MLGRYPTTTPSRWDRYSDSSTLRRPVTGYFANGSGSSSYRDPHSGATYHVYGSGSSGAASSYGGSAGSPWSTGHHVQPSRPDMSTVLAVKEVDLMVKENGQAHHTDRYEISQPDQRPPQLVIRRGQPFSISIDFTKEYDPEKDDLKLVFEAGDNPSSVNGTYVEFILSGEDLPKQWGAKIVSKEMNSNDDNGVLMGRWSEPYTDGRSPLSWTGSVKLLEKYWKTKAPVKYGQCWVFSGVCTTG